MRKIKGMQILVFCIALFTAVALAVLTNILLLGHIPLGDFRGVVMTVSCILFVYIFAVIVYRCGLRLMPLPAGEFANASTEEFVYHVYLLFFLVLFYPVMRSGLIPVPIMRVFYLGLGARLGDNTYSSGIIFDPIFVELGANCIVGQSALIIPHVIEGDRARMQRRRRRVAVPAAIEALTARAFERDQGLGIATIGVPGAHFSVVRGNSRDEWCPQVLAEQRLDYPDCP